MKCPYCGNQEDNVLDSRPVRDGMAIRRRRQCVACGQRFKTYEEIEEKRLMVVKKNGDREPFKRDKILQGFFLACRKRPVSIEKMEEATEEVERALINRLESEVSTNDIGELVMDQLLLIDPVAYVRFASVYRQFEDANQFREVVESLRKRKRQKS
ncbi:MAG: transcriptional regulator NrdR [bacterium]|jgi:transcriptional repressor NrdR